MCQGSTLSGSLYLVYTLDYPLLHHPGNLDMENYDKSKDNKMTTFIDDSSIHIKIGQDKDQNNTMITNTLDKIKTYMDSTSLVLNKDKSNNLVISPDPNIRENISIDIPGKEKPIIPERSLKFLGIEIQDNLKWNNYISEGKENLVKRLTQKLNPIPHDLFRSSV